MKDKAYGRGERDRNQESESMKPKGYGRGGGQVSIQRTQKETNEDL